MQPGKLDKIITFQSKSASTGDYGGQAFTWADFATVWAHVQPLKGRELIAAKAAQSETDVRVYIRYLAGLNTSMRIVYNGKNYDITGIVDIDEKNVEMEISAKTGLSEG